MAQGSVYVNLIMVACVPVALAVLLYLLEQKTAYGKLNKTARLIITGILFGGAAVLGTEFGVNLGGYVINARDAAPVIAALVFNPISGIIAGVIGGVERWFAALWGAGMYTRIACSVSTIFAGVLAAFFKSVMFTEEKPRWFQGLMTGLIAETFHMMMVFVTNISDPHSAYVVVKSVTIPMITVNSLAVAVATFIIWNLDRKNITHHEKRDISSFFRQFLVLTIVVAYAATTVITLLLETNQSKMDTANLINTNIEDVENDVKDAADKTLLNLTYLVANDLDQVESLNAKKNMLPVLVERYSVDEISIISGGGTIIASTVPAYIGFYMGSGAQSSEFMEVISGEVKNYVQEYQPVTYDNSSSMKYAAVNTGYYTIQVGYSGEALQAEISKQSEGITNNRHIGSEGAIIIVDPDWIIVSNPRGGEGLNLAATGIYLNAEQVAPGELFETPFYGKDCFATYAISEGYYILGVMLKDEALFSRDMMATLTIFMEIITFGILFVLTFYLVRKLVVDNVHTANHVLRKISGGDLDVEIQPYKIAEFDELAIDINTTVSTLKGYIAEAAARIDKDLKLAKEIQAGALPSIFPPYPNEKAFDIYATMDPAKEVGGDFYDFFYLGGRKFGFLVADVSGKGVPAAMFMMTAKTLLKNLAESGLPTCEIITRANDELCANNEAGMFVTCWLGIVDLGTGELQYTNAGHNPPAIRHADGKFEYLKGTVNLVLACMEGSKYNVETAQLDPGDTIFIYTDGVTEATDAEHQLYGEERLLNALNNPGKVTAQELCKKVREDIDLFVGEAEQFDDITMLAFNYEGDSIVRKQDGGIKVTQVNELTIEATTENIAKATLFVDEILEQYDCPIKAQTEIDIALDELLSNIAFYAYNPEVGPATIMVEVTEEPLQVVISFIDNGVPYDPLKKADPNTNIPIEKRDVGGLGIFMVKQTMDDITYEYKDGQNILTIKKALL